MLLYMIVWVCKYVLYGFVVIGVYVLEFVFECDIGNVKKVVYDFGIDYLVVIDNGYVIWCVFNNEYWFVYYFIDV